MTSISFTFNFCFTFIVLQIFLTIRDAVQDFLHEIYFLPDHPELEKIKAVLQEYRKVFHFFTYGMEDLKYKIAPDFWYTENRSFTVKAGGGSSCTLEAGAGRSL